MAVRLTENWKVIFGPILVLVVLFARGGLIGLCGAPWQCYQRGIEHV